MKLHTRRVTRTYANSDGSLTTKKFWIAFPEHLLAYPTRYTIEHAWGSGDTKTAALADAEE